MSGIAPPGLEVRDSASPFPYRLTTWLLDVNVLLALLDPTHLHHERAHQWFAVTGQSWASCAVTQNGAMRIMSHASYPNRVESTALAAELVADLCSQPGHRFWADDVSLLDAPFVLRERLSSSAQITDTWLLALAVKRGGRLATFDSRLVTTAVRGGDAAKFVIG
ncbi:MAG: TA system VapC family ribonuclease toxin [Lysobacteraceae bacterium]